MTKSKTIQKNLNFFLFAAYAASISHYAEPLLSG